MPELDDPDVNEEEDALLPERVEIVFNEPVEPRRIELGVPLVKLDEPDVYLDPLDELAEDPVDTEDDPLANPVSIDEDPVLAFKDETAFKVEPRPLLAELEPTFRDADVPLLVKLDEPDVNEEDDFMLSEVLETLFTDPVEPRLIEVEDPLVKLDKPDVNIVPLDELTERPVEAKDDPLVAPVLSDDDPLLALKVKIEPSLAELDNPELRDTDEPLLPVDENPE